MAACMARDVQSKKSWGLNLGSGLAAFIAATIVLFLVHAFTGRRDGRGRERAPRTSEHQQSNGRRIPDIGCQV